MQQQASLKKQKLQEKTLPELPPEVWAMIMLWLTRRGSPWLAGGLRAMCLVSKTHAASYQAAELMAQIVHRLRNPGYFWRCYSCFKRLGPARKALRNARQLGIDSFPSRWLRRGPDYLEQKASTYILLWTTFAATVRQCMVRCHCDVSKRRPDGESFSLDGNGDHALMSLCLGAQQNQPVMHTISMAISFKATCIPKLRTGLHFDSFTRQAEATKTSVSIAEAAKWYAWTMAHFSAAYAMDLTFEVRYGFGNMPCHGRLRFDWHTLKKACTEEKLMKVLVTDVFVDLIERLEKITPSTKQHPFQIRAYMKAAVYS